MKKEPLYYYEVAVATPLTKTFTYHAKNPDFSIGCRVLVPFGPRKLFGVILKRIEKSLLPKAEGIYKTKAILKKLEDETLFSPELLELAKWMSSYYHTSLGEVLKAMLPAKEQTSLVKTWHLNPDKDLSTEKEEEKRLLEKLFSKKKSLTFQTIQKKYKFLEKEGQKLPSLASLKKGKWIFETLEEKETKAKKSETEKKLETKEPEKAPKLTPEQEDVCSLFFKTRKEEKNLKPFLLQGVTGSGKTEVYLHTLDRILTESDSSEKKAQALVLVPEISLTPQMTKAFTTRFPGKVSVLHSALPDKKRYEEILKIFHNKTQILIGARSCVFAPLANLKFIVIDEEHDTSYKQSTLFSYHAKDTALVRAHRLNIPIILGSATPSAESFWNAQTGKYHHLKLTKRVHKSKLPEVYLKEIPAKIKGEKLLLNPYENNLKTKSSHLISDEILAALKENFEKGKQSIVIVNRRGYAYYLLDLKTKKSVTCSKCSVSMTLHNHMKTLSCHYCDRSLPTEKLLEQKETSYVAIGYGSQKIELYLKEQIPEANIVRLDSDTSKKKEILTKTLSDFREEKINILVGTQILAKGHDFPKVTLVALLEVDESLNLPDFRAGERTFQLLVQAAGRAGRQEDKGHVFIQTTQKDHKLILNATDHNYDAFILDEIKFREKYCYAPFYKMALLEFSSLDKRLLDNYTEQLASWLESYLEAHEEENQNLRLQGPYKPGIEKINQRWRKHFLLRSKNPKNIHTLINLVKSNDSKRPSSIRFKIDIDPQSML